MKSPRQLAKEHAAFLASMSRAAYDVNAERRRQTEVEGYTPEHDDTEHANGDLANAASAWAHTQQIVMAWGSALDKRSKPRRRQLVIAGALILAEIERLDRRDR
jgi:hypothetical protein